MASLVLTVIGDDRAGLVDALSGVIAERGGNWDESHMTELAGKFAGIVLVTVPDDGVDALIAGLDPLQGDGLLQIMVERAADEVPESSATRRFSLELVGQDHAGIVHDISQALAAAGVNINDLTTSTTSAPMAGGTLFRAEAVLDVPAAVALDDLRSSLEALADELMVDIDLHD